MTEAFLDTENLFHDMTIDQHERAVGLVLGMLDWMERQSLPTKVVRSFGKKPEWDGGVAVFEHNVRRARWLFRFQEFPIGTDPVPVTADDRIWVGGFRVPKGQHLAEREAIRHSRTLRADGFGGKAELLGGGDHEFAEYAVELRASKLHPRIVLNENAKRFRNAFRKGQPYESVPLSTVSTASRLGPIGEKLYKELREQRRATMHRDDVERARARRAQASAEPPTGTDAPPPPPAPPVPPAAVRRIRDTLRGHLAHDWPDMLTRMQASDSLASVAAELGWPASAIQSMTAEDSDTAVAVREGTVALNDLRAFALRHLLAAELRELPAPERSTLQRTVGAEPALHVLRGPLQSALAMLESEEHPEP